jgi:hypothetical protein
MRLTALTPKRLTVLITAVSAAVLIPVGALAGTASPSAPATAARASASATGIPAISVNSVTLVARGAAVQVVFTVTCGARDDGIVDTTTTQAVDEHVAQGTQGVVLKCTGKPQQASVVAAANVNGAPFFRRIAVVMAHVQDCPGANCTQASTNKVLTISR